VGIAWGKNTGRDHRTRGSDCRFLRVDRRGCGASPADGRVDFERDAHDVAQLLGDGAHLVGHSYGGVVSLLAAAQRPDAVRSLALIEPPAFGGARGHPALEEVIGDITTATRQTQGPRA